MKDSSKGESQRMRTAARQRGFSLTEVLLATGILALGFVMIAMAFPVGVWLTSAAAERTIGPVAAQEAAAKVQLYGLDLRDWATRGNRIGLLANRWRLYNWDILNQNTITSLTGLGYNNEALINDYLKEESFYPSLPASYYVQHPSESRKYCWSVLCQKEEAHNNPQNVRLRIFVCRLGSPTLRYYGFTYYSDTDTYSVVTGGVDRPMPIPVTVLHHDSNPAIPPNVLRIDVPANQRLALTAAEFERFFTDDCEILHDEAVDGILGTGGTYRVLERRDVDGDRVRDLVLDRVFMKNGAGETRETVWVVPPAQNSGKNPCIGIYTGVAAAQ